MGDTRTPGEVEKQLYPPLRVDSQHLTCDWCWPLGQQGQPMAKLPRDWKVQDQFPHVPSKLPGREQVLGDAQGPVRTLLCSWTREGF